MKGQAYRADKALQAAAPGSRESGRRGVRKRARGVGLIRGRGRASTGFQRAQVLRELHGSRRAPIHRTLYGLLVASQDIAFTDIAEITGLDIEQNVYLPLPEGVTVHGPTQQLLNQAVEPREHDFTVLNGVDHPSILSAGRSQNLTATFDQG